MGILGEMIREVREVVETVNEECGLEDLKDEIKDAFKALKGK